MLFRPLLAAIEAFQRDTKTCHCILTGLERVPSCEFIDAFEKKWGALLAEDLLFAIEDMSMTSVSPSDMPFRKHQPSHRVS
jgi:hypothetical protein